MKLLVDPSLPNHVKLRKFAVLAGVSGVQALGHVISLWSVVILQAESGDLVNWSNDDVSLACNWSGDAKKLVDALVSSKFLDRVRGKLFVHEWLEHQGDLIRKRQDWKKRQRKARNVTRDIRVTVTQNGDGHASPSPTVPSPTLPYIGRDALRAETPDRDSPNPSRSKAPCRNCGGDGKVAVGADNGTVLLGPCNVCQR